nr:hypothetical protein [Clostridia bacterium]
TQPWWNGNMAEALSVAGSINYINGDILLLDNDATWVLMFNKGMAEDYSLGSIYELVDNDEWYYDKMDEMMKKVASDLDGDGEMTWENDRFSIATSLYSGNSLYYNFGTTISEKDSDDLPIYALDESRGALIAERMGAMMADESSLIDRADDDIDSESLRQVFESGRALFYGEVLQCMIRMRGSETDFGVVPWPKLDEAQDDYGHVGVSIVVMSIAVPKTNTDLEMTGLLLEAMAAKSMSTLTPAYYDVTLTGKAMRDEESTRMLDIILGTIKHDIAFVYDWNGFSNKLRDVIVKNTGNFSSLVASEKTAFEKAMQDTIDAYLEAAK